MAARNSIKPRGWTNTLERVFNVALVIAALALAGTLIKRQFFSRRGGEAPQASKTSPTPGVGSLSERASVGTPRTSPRAQETPSTSTEKPNLFISDHADFVSEQQLKDAIRAGQVLVVLDVRERRDFAEKHFRDAKNMPVDEIEVRAVNELSLDDQIVLFCGCKNDEMSKVAQKILIQQGFVRITFLHNGTENCGSCS